MPTVTSEDKLTDKQREVLALVREGKNPTDIGKALGISSQAVHGHFRRLRGHGLLPNEPTAPGRAAARARRDHRPGPEDALMAVQREIERQLTELHTRDAEISEAIEALQREREEIEQTRARLRPMLDQAQS